MDKNVDKEILRWGALDSPQMAKPRPKRAAADCVEAVKALNDPS
jgi:hypothetical protein